MTEQGEKVRSEFDTMNRLLRLVKASRQPLRLLRYVDPYGITQFNRLQMDDLVWDADDLASATNDAETLAVLSKIRAFTIEVKMHPHLYIRFVGD